MSRMGVAAMVRVEPDVWLPSPHGHASGHPLPGHWPIPFITWKEPVLRTAATQGLEQLQRGGAGADGAGLTAHIEQVCTAMLGGCTATAGNGN